MFKDLDVIIEKASVFDPILQGNSPHVLFKLNAGKKKMDVLHMPCPTQQIIINKANVIPEFIGFLKYLKNQKMLFN